MMAAFIDRADAGRQLAKILSQYRGQDAVVLGLPRGGVAVGYTVARDLGLPLRTLVVRKLGAPQNPELAIGAVSENGVQWLDYRIVHEVGATASYIEREILRQAAEAARRQNEYRAHCEPLALDGRIAIVGDDGIATGSTALVAAQSARKLEASKVILATPVASPHAAVMLKPFVDKLVAAQMPDPFLAVGMHYERFGQVSDDEVIRYLTAGSGD